MHIELIRSKGKGCGGGRQRRGGDRAEVVDALSSISESWLYIECVDGATDFVMGLPCAVTSVPSEAASFSHSLLCTSTFYIHCAMSTSTTNVIGSHPTRTNNNVSDIQATAFFMFSTYRKLADIRPQFCRSASVWDSRNWKFLVKSLRSSAVCGGRLQRPSPCLIT